MADRRVVRQPPHTAGHPADVAAAALERYVAMVGCPVAGRAPRQLWFACRRSRVWWPIPSRDQWRWPAPPAGAVTLERPREPRGTLCGRSATLFRPRRVRCSRRASRPPRRHPAPAVGPSARWSLRRRFRAACGGLGYPRAVAALGLRPGAEGGPRSRRSTLPLRSLTARRRRPRPASTLTERFTAPRRRTLLRVAERRRIVMDTSHAATDNAPTTIRIVRYTGRNRDPDTASTGPGAPPDHPARPSLDRPSPARPRHPWRADPSLAAPPTCIGVTNR